MYDFFLDMIKQMPDVVEYSGENENVAPYGRVDFEMRQGDLLLVQTFGDMRKYEPALEINVERPNYDDYFSMMDKIVDGRISEACAISRRITLSEVKYEIHDRKKLSGRMADVEYPMLELLKEKGVKFSLLNPSKGTLRRTQVVMGATDIGVYIEQSEEENFNRYVESLDKVNLYKWQLNIVDRRPDHLCYCGFTTKKNLTKNVFGFEMNPKSIAISYQGEYTLKSGENYDLIDVARDELYHYVERYDHEVEYHRIYPAELAVLLRPYKGWYERPYLPLYNFISWEPFFDVRVVEPKDMLGYKLVDGKLWSPYDRVIIEAHFKTFVELDGETVPLTIRDGIAVPSSDLAPADTNTTISTAPFFVYAVKKRWKEFLHVLFPKYPVIKPGSYKYDGRLVRDANGPYNIVGYRVTGPFIPQLAFLLIRYTWEGVDPVDYLLSLQWSRSHKGVLINGLKFYPGSERPVWYSGKGLRYYVDPERDKVMFFLDGVHKPYIHRYKGKWFNESGVEVEPYRIVSHVLAPVSFFSYQGQSFYPLSLLDRKMDEIQNVVRGHEGFLYRYSGNEYSCGGIIEV